MILQTFGRPDGFGNEDLYVAWPVDGVLAVRLRHRWLDAEGREVAPAETTSLPRRVTPGSWSRA